MIEDLLSLRAGASFTSPVTLLLVVQLASLWQSILLFRRRGVRTPQLTPLCTTAILAATWQMLWTSSMQSLIESGGLPAHVIAAAGLSLSIAALGVALTQAMAMCRKLAV